MYQKIAKYALKSALKNNRKCMEICQKKKIKYNQYLVKLNICAIRIYIVYCYIRILILEFKMI